MAFEQLRDRWEHMAPRERGLAGLLAITFVVCVFAFIGITIRDGLGAIEDGNEEKRQALRALELQRQRLAEGDDGPTVKIPDKPISLSSYLEEVAGEVGVTIPAYQPQPSVPRGKYTEVSMNIDLREVTVEQLAQFLEKVETRDRSVVITNLRIEKSFRDQDKLRKASMTVTTYHRAEAVAAASPGQGG